MIWSSICSIIFQTILPAPKTKSPALSLLFSAPTTSSSISVAKWCSSKCHPPSCDIQSCKLQQAKTSNKEWRDLISGSHQISSSRIQEPSLLMARFLSTCLISVMASRRDTKTSRLSATSQVGRVAISTTILNSTHTHLGLSFPTSFIII